MAIIQANAGTQVFIDKWNGSSFGNTLDVTDVFLAADWGYESWSQSGLRRINGSVTIGGFPQTALAESLNPRINTARFQKGNRVRIAYNSVAIASLYIKKFPLPAHPGSPEIDIEVGCALELLSYRQPPSDAEEESNSEDFSEERSAQGVISAYLAYAGVTDITTVSGSCSGNLFVQQKDGVGSWVEEAGKIAFANGSYLWQDSDGAIQISAIALQPNSPDFEINVGGWDGQEIEFEPVDAGETPAEQIITTGESVEFEDTGGNFSDTSTEYGLASSVSPYGEDERIAVAREITTETFSGNTRSRDVYRYECFCAINPFYPSNFSLTLSQIIFENWTYEGDEKGRLISYDKTVRSPVVAVAQDYAGNILVDQPGSIQDMALRTVEQEFARYSYDDQDAAKEISKTKKKIAVAIAPTLFLGATEVQGYTAFQLVPNGGTYESWNGDHDSGLWRYKYVEYGSLAQNARSGQTVTSGQLATGLIKRTVQTSNTGATQPPSAERREPSKIERREAIEGDAEFLLPIDSAFQEREREYQIPYGNTVSKLNARAEELGQLLIGRSLGCSFTLPIADWETPTNIHPRVDFATADGIQSFVVDNLSFAIDATSAVVSGDGLYLGVVANAEEPAKITKPYRERTRVKIQARLSLQTDDQQPDFLDQVVQVGIRMGIRVTTKLEISHQVQAIAQFQATTNEPTVARIRANTGFAVHSYPDKIRVQARTAIRHTSFVDFTRVQLQAIAQIEFEGDYLFQTNVQMQAVSQFQFEGGVLNTTQVQVQAITQIQAGSASNAYYDAYEAAVLAAGDQIRGGREDDVLAFIEAFEPFFEDCELLLTFTDRRNGLGSNSDTPSFVPIWNPNNHVITATGFTEANRITEGIQFDGSTTFIDLGLNPADLPYNAYGIAIACMIGGGNNTGYLLSYEEGSRNIYIKPSSNNAARGMIDYTIQTTTGDIDDAYEIPGGNRQVSQTHLFGSKASTSPPQHEYYIANNLTGSGFSLIETSAYATDYTTTWDGASVENFEMGRRNTAFPAGTYTNFKAQAIAFFTKELSGSDRTALNNALQIFLEATARPAAVFSFADYSDRVVAAGDTIQAGKQTAIEDLIDALIPYKANIVQLITFTDRTGISIVPIYDPWGYGPTGTNFVSGNRTASGLQCTGTQYVSTNIPIFRVPLASFTMCLQGIATNGSGSSTYWLSSEVDGATLHQMIRSSSVTSGFNYAAPTPNISRTPSSGTGTSVNYLFTSEFNTYSKVAYYENGSYIATSANSFEYAPNYQNSTNTTAPITLGARRTPTFTASQLHGTLQAFCALDIGVNSSDAGAIAAAIDAFVVATT